MCKNTYKNIIIIIFLIIFININLSAQQDSVKTDSSSYSVKPLLEHGSLIFNIANKRVIDKKTASWINYSNINDILKKNLPTYSMDLGQYGEVQHLSLFGGGLRDNSVASNGVQLSSPLFNPYNINNFAPDFFESLEVLLGSDAVIFGNNSSGMLVNIQEIKYNTRKPYTKLFYNQGAGDYMAGDVVYSQNLSEQLNLFLGARSQSAKNQYLNNFFDYWNLRGGIRWNIDTNTSISLIENFTQHKFQRNGGVDINQTDNMYNAMVSTPVYINHLEEELLHNINLTGTRLLTPSTKLSTNVFFSHSSNDYASDNSPSKVQDFSLRNKYNYYQTGINAGISKNSSFMDFDAGGEIRYLNLNSSALFDAKRMLIAFGYGRLKFNLSDNISISGGGRLSYYDDIIYSNFGASLFLKNFINSRFDFSYSENLPNIYSANHTKKESNLLAFYMMSEQIGDLKIEANIFYRKKDNFLEFSLLGNNSSEIMSIGYTNLSFIGGSLNLDYEIIPDLHLKLWNISQFVNRNGEPKDYLPKLNSGIEINYRLVIGRSQFIAGINAAFNLKSELSYGFSPVHFINNFYSSFESKPASYDGINAYFITRLGPAAFVKISGDNLLNSQYYFVNYYPIPGRSIKVSVFWEFFD